MSFSEVARRRIRAQHLDATDLRRPRDVVSWLGAVQAQDYLGALWAVGLRLAPVAQATEALVEAALADRSIVRSWPMRGTLHFVAAEDLGWLLALLGPKVVARSARRHAELNLDAAAFTRGRALLEQALEGGRCLTRAEVYRVLTQGKVSPAGQRGIHLIQRLALDGVLCFGARLGKQQTFALLDEWLAPGLASTDSKVRSREESLFELARRYFTGHGPATLADFIWWSGLPAAEAREAVALARAARALDEAKEDGAVLYSGQAPRRRALASSGSLQLLPGFDELWVGYQDRSALLEPAHHPKVNPGANGMLSPTMVLDGRVIGTWKRVLGKQGVSIAARPFGPLSPQVRRKLEVAAERYARFLGVPLTSLDLGR